MRRFFIMNPLLDPTTDGSGGGGTGDGSTGAGASGQQQTGGQTGTQTAPSQTSGTNTTGGQGTQTPASNDGQPRTGASSGNGQSQSGDPRDFIPRHRFNEVSGQNRQLQEQIQDLSRRLTLALGGEPVDPQTAKGQQIRDAFFNLPGNGTLKRLAELSDEQIEQLLNVPSQVSTTRDAELRSWQRHGNQVVDTISDRVAEAIGAETLSDDQKGDLRDNFSSWIKNRARAELAQAVDRYGEEAVARDERRFSPTIRAYEDNDAKLLDEFVTRYTKNWVEPARRSATARTSTRTRPVPNGNGRNAPASSVTRPDTFKSLDERLDYAVNLAKERGVQFGR